MPEGHTVHRTANRFRKDFVGQEVEVFSPQGRFDLGAKLISGQRLIQSKAVGKQLFLEFENLKSLRIHLGIYGKWNFYDVPISSAPEPWGQVRARFGSSISSADLRGPTVCEVIESEEVLRVLRRLGPDPLNPDPTGQELERFVSKVRSSKAPIGALLMNQAVVSGIGNVYRAELLFRAKLNPKTEGKLVSEGTLLGIWDDAVNLMKIGVRRGVMLTREGYLTGKVNLPERYYVYKRNGLPCRECSSVVLVEEFFSRKLYFCPACQK
jgi:endonuclease VIII